MSRRGLLVTVVLALAAAVVMALAASAFANPIGEVTEFPTAFAPGTAANGHEGTIVTGPDGDIWFTAGEGFSPALGRVEPLSGHFTEAYAELYPQYQLTAGDGALWFSSDASAGVLGSYNTATEVESNYYVEFQPESVTLGHDGSFWFTNTSEGPPYEYVARLYLSALPPEPLVKGFQLPSGDTMAPEAPIAPGPEGNVWFGLNDVAGTGRGGLGEITPSGTITTPWNLFSGTELATSLAEGPSESLFGQNETIWFTQPGGDQIGVFVPGAGLGEFPLGTTPNNQPEQIVKGAEGNMWFTQPGSDQIGRINTLTGEVDEFSTGTGPADAPGAITVGPEGNLWFTQGASQIGRMGTEGEPTATAPVIETNPANVTVAAGEEATFSSAANGNPTPTVQWEVSSDGGSSWSVVPGATSPTLTLSAVTTSQSEDEYRAVWSSSAGTEISTAATLIVTSTPTVVTGGTSSLTSTSATLNGTVDPNSLVLEECNVHYEVSGVEEEGQCASLPAGLTGAQPIEGMISGLTPNTTYRYYFSAGNQAGSSNGGVESFTTLLNASEETSSSPSGEAEASIGPALRGKALEGAGTITVGQYGANPVGSPQFMSAGKYFDAYLSEGSTFTSLELTDCELGGGSSLYWWNPQANGGSGEWQVVSDETKPAGSPPCITATINAGTSPDLAQMVGTVFGVALPSGPRPTVKKLSMKKGSTAGGTRVRITGTGFAGVSAVNFGSKAATEVIYNSPQSVTAVSPAEAPGKVSVTVTTPNGTSLPSAKAKFTFKAPKGKR
jgi:streptogramin lyase